MALPYKTGSQEVIDFMVYLETRPMGVILSGEKRPLIPNLLAIQEFHTLVSRHKGISCVQRFH